MPVAFGVLGPVAAWDVDGAPVALRGPRHRAVLARLLVARGRVVPVDVLVDDLWPDPPPGAVAAVRTFVAALRRALEPDRPPRAPARLLVTAGPGYALHADDLDAERFTGAVTAAAGASPAGAAARLEEALGWWRGPAYADVADEPWARAERTRLGELRLLAVERSAGARLALGLAAEVAADLDAHVAEHPWREEAWALLARALARAGRQGDALAVLRRARALLVAGLGVDPGPALRRAESDVLRRADEPGGAIERVWAETTAAYDRAVAPGTRGRLEATVGLLRALAVTGGGGLEAARAQRAAAVAAADEQGDPELLARVVGAYDVPAVWTRADDPAQAAAVVGAAERALRALPPTGRDHTRARLLATVAVESRGLGSARAHAAAEEAERLARRAGDPALLAFALDGVFLQAVHRPGLAPRRDAVGAELVALSARHGLVASEVLGHLVRMQARCALADVTGAGAHADAADRLGERHDLPLVAVLTRWYRALRTDATGATAEEAEAAYRAAAVGLRGAGMPGLERGLLPLALLGARVRRGLPVEDDDTVDWGPHRPWVAPLLLLARGRRDAAAAALAAAPDPPPDLLAEALWCLLARAAVALGDRVAVQRARAALTPAAGEWAAGSGLLTLGPVARYLDELAGASGG